MVRIGGGWDTLENYLDRHDPCRCQAKGKLEDENTATDATTYYYDQELLYLLF